ncbi:MAG: hypothetical protein KF752_10115 [Pirellulaceae bacterium]|nr:hypothetical protein [Pirellulaceae bacterium]
MTSTLTMELIHDLVRSNLLATLQFQAIILPALAGATAVIAIGGVLVYTTQRHVSDRRPRGWIATTGYAAFWLAILVLAATAFGSIVQQGHMQRQALLGHLMAAGAFTIFLAVVAVGYLPRGERDQNRWWLEKWSAWLLILSGVATAGTMLLGMLPVVDTAGLNNITAVHRWSGLATAVAAMFHLFSLLAGRYGMR